MPLPTTRYARFVYRQAKYTRRARRMYKHNSGIGLQHLGHHGDGKLWSLIENGLLASHGVNSRSFSGNRVIPGGGLGINPLFHGGGALGWPHVRFTGAAYNLKRAAGYRQKKPILGYQVHRVVRWGHKANRMNGAGRNAMGAEWFGYINGYYPAWDLLLRYPQLGDLLFAPLANISGIYPWGPVSPF